MKWAASKKRGPRGADQPRYKRENIVRRVLTAITTTLKSTYNYIKLLQTTYKKVPNLKKTTLNFHFDLQINSNLSQVFSPARFVFAEV